MPELPEVQALADAFATRAVGRSIAQAHLCTVAALKTAQPPLSDLVGTEVLDVIRIGKFLDWQLVDANGEPLHLVVHLARAGWIRWLPNPSPTPPKPGRGPIALRVTFCGAEGVAAGGAAGGAGGVAAGGAAGGVDLTEAGTKKRLAIYLVRDPNEIGGVARLGPDPLAADFNARQLDAVLAAAGGRQLKGVLRDQSTIAGIGNAYSDEILHAARLSPFAAAGKLDADQRAALLDGIRSVLFNALASAAASQPETLKSEKKRSMRVHGRTGEPCPVCGTAIAEVSFADSSLQYCPTCQTAGRPLADRRMSRLLK